MISYLVRWNVCICLFFCVTWARLSEILIAICSLMGLFLYFSFYVIFCKKEFALYHLNFPRNSC